MFLIFLFLINYISWFVLWICVYRRNGDGSYEMIRKGKIDKINLSCKSIRLLRGGTCFNDDYFSILLTII